MIRPSGGRDVGGRDMGGRDMGGRDAFAPLIPSMSQVEGGALIFILCGDGARMEKKYGDRGLRFLLFEAGHVMQSVCLSAASVGLCCLPLGGFYERALERELRLPRTDLALYIGLCGEPITRRAPLAR